MRIICLCQDGDVRVCKPAEVGLLRVRKVKTEAGTRTLNQRAPVVPSLVPSPDYQHSLCHLDTTFAFASASPAAKITDPQREDSIHGIVS
jgi:hypothetical protein